MNRKDQAPGLLAGLVVLAILFMLAAAILAGLLVIRL